MGIIPTGLLRHRPLSHITGEAIHTTRQLDLAVGILLRSFQSGTAAGLGHMIASGGPHDSYDL